LCGARKLQGLVPSANPAPQGEKSPIDQDDHRAGEFAVYATTEACGDGRVYQAGVIRLPPTNFTTIDDCVDKIVPQYSTKMCPVSSLNCFEIVLDEMGIGEGHVSGGAASLAPPLFPQR
jgi:hypothetical protein